MYHIWAVYGFLATKSKLSFIPPILMHGALPPYLLLPLQLLLLLVTVVTNVCMLALFSRALVKSSTSAEASLLNLVGSLVGTGLASSILFKESLGHCWFLGALLILAGSYLVLIKEKTE